MNWKQIKFELPKEDGEYLVGNDGVFVAAIFKKGNFFDSEGKLIDGATRWMDPLEDEKRKFTYKIYPQVDITMKIEKNSFDSTESSMMINLETNILCYDDPREIYFLFPAGMHTTFPEHRFLYGEKDKCLSEAFSFFFDKIEMNRTQAFYKEGESKIVEFNIKDGEEY